MTTPRQIAASVLCMLALGAGASACSSQEGATPSGGTATSSALTASTTDSPTPSTTDSTTPAVCADVTALRASADKIASIEIGQGALATLTTELATMQATLQQLPADASAQYSSQVDALKAASTRLQSSLQAAVQAPSATTLATVGTDARALGDAVRALSAAVGDGC
ncbi:hypothetical protein [Humibacillus xanthopallidus]|uniref:hypothetical protein n=1 Tax=Humibacillus xanthopallidus TaxID=412689 RepID=UPI00384E9CAB